MLMQGADNIMHNAYEAQQREALNKRVLKDSSPDEYWISFVSSGFQPISPSEEPPKNEWAGLRVATGGLEGGQGQAIIFLVPPEIGRLNSGQLAIVELGNDGQPNIARYLAR